MNSEDIAEIIRLIIRLVTLITCIFADDVTVKINAVMIYLFFTVS
jgi:hypothetical protein